VDLSPITLLLGALGVIAIVFIVGWVTGARTTTRDSTAANTPAADGRFPDLWHLGIGAVTIFFDTLGIGSFATTTSFWRFGGLVPDRLIPGTLNVGHTFPTFVQAFIYTQIVKVDPTTLIAMIAASVAGAWLGAGVVAGWPKRKIQIGMGFALLVFAVILSAKALGRLPSGDVGLLGVTGVLLGVAVVGNFILGALMTLGIGLYAPCMVLVSLLGMNPTAAFPIMMGSCAFLMPVGSLRFIRARSYSLRAALGLAIGGVPAVLIAALIVKSLPLTWVMWLVVVVVVYTAATLLRAAMTERTAAERVPVPDAAR
jgi:uncharacterized membrane protein YfcA